MRGSVLPAVLVALAALAPASRASAANASKPRIPVVWTASDCATIVDRSATPTIHFDYSIAMEESYELTVDEVEDSRTHQFFAFGKQDFIGKPPLWITQSDVDRTKAVDPIVAMKLIDPQDILELTNRFAASDWLRITPDDARVPITDAQAAMGVDWDVSAVTPGTYEIWGYTWEPEGNEWARRPGFVKVIASADAIAEAGPSLSLAFSEATIVAGSPYTPPGCADVTPGTTLTVQWGERIGTLEPEWITANEDEAIASGTLTFAFVPPDEAGGKSIALRAIVTDAEGRSYTAYAPARIQVDPNPNPGSESSESGSDGGGDEDGGGCSCIVGGAPPAWMLIVPALAGRLRRRR